MAEEAQEEWVQDPTEPRPEPRTASADDLQDELIRNYIEEGKIKRRWLDEVRKIFKTGNWFVLGCVLFLAVVDNLLIAYDIVEPQYRVVTANVVMALIAATVAQVGAIAAAVWKSWYPATEAPRVSHKRKPSA